MKKQIVNPFLPLNEYIPDGEPHVFGDRVYLFGSHDKEGGERLCMLDYVVYSAPVNNLTDWRCEGTVYRTEQDPFFKVMQNKQHEEDCRYITGIRDSTDIGFKYFDLQGKKKLTVSTRGKASGSLEIRIGAVLAGIIAINPSDSWIESSTEIEYTGVAPLYFCYVGSGWTDFKAFSLSESRN